MTVELISIHVLLLFCDIIIIIQYFHAKSISFTVQFTIVITMPRYNQYQASFSSSRYFREKKWPGNEAILTDEQLTITCQMFVFAGSEFGIVLLSTVRSQLSETLPVMRGEDQPVDLGWRRENLGFITDRHQICVGITRCKYGLIIIGK